MLNWRVTIVLLFLSINLSAQTLGGNSLFNFLKLPNTPLQTALGGTNNSIVSNDVGMAFQNPALLEKEMHSQINAVFNSFYGGIKVYHLSGAYTHEKLKTSFAGGIQFFDYGSTTETDAAGNIIGKFRPVDWVAQVQASRKYLDKWNYGLTLKLISSSYGQYSSNGLAADAGVLYLDSISKFSASVVVKNIGVQLKKYEGTQADDLPFDLQAGITKRLAKAPFSFSLTAHHIHRFDISYIDTVFNNENGYSNESSNSFTFSKLLSHLVLSATIHIDKRFEVHTGYNFLRRKELNIGNGSNGLNGFSAGLSVLFPKIQIRYGRAGYQFSGAYNQLGINLKISAK